MCIRGVTGAEAAGRAYDRDCHACAWAVGASQARQIPGHACKGAECSSGAGGGRRGSGSAEVSRGAGAGLRHVDCRTKAAGQAGQRRGHVDGGAEAAGRARSALLSAAAAGIGTRSARLRLSRVTFAFGARGTRQGRGASSRTIRAGRARSALLSAAAAGIRASEAGLTRGLS